MKIGLTDRLIGVIWGIVGGGTKFFLDMAGPAMTRSERIEDACLIAFLSAVCGLLAKDLYQWVKKRTIKKNDI